jgi:hypothetical protein
LHPKTHDARISPHAQGKNFICRNGMLNAGHGFGANAIAVGQPTGRVLFSANSLGKIVGAEMFCTKLECSY